MPIFNPDVPVDNSLIAAGELRDQFNSLKDVMDALSFDMASKVNVPSVTTLSQTISNPPTQAQVQAIQDKLNELILALIAV
jgi:hypothetical protein